MILSQDQTLVCISGTSSKLVNVSDDDSFEFCTRALSLGVALKGHLLGHALSSFQRSLLQPNPDLDAPDSFQLPSGDVLSSQGNGDFTVSHRPCQASLRNFFKRGAGFSRPASRPAARHSNSILKGEGVRCVIQDAVAWPTLLRRAGVSAYFGR